MPRRNYDHRAGRRHEPHGLDWSWLEQEMRDRRTKPAQPAKHKKHNPR